MKTQHSPLALIALSGLLFTLTASNATANVATAPVVVVEKTTSAAIKPVAIVVKGTGRTLKKVVYIATKPLQLLTR